MTRRLLLLVLLYAGLVAAQDRPIRALLVTGANNHDWEYTAPRHKETLEHTGRFKVTMTSKPKEALVGDLSKTYDVIVLDYNGPRWGAEAEKAFLDAVEGGVGVSVVHASNNAFPGWVEFEKISFLCWRKGTGHGRFHPFDVTVTDRNHPITADLPDLLDHPDELYHKLVHMHGQPYRVLGRAFSHEKSGGTGRHEPMIMISEYGKGRVFHTPLGHVWKNVGPSRVSVNDPQFRLLLARGTEWAATGRVTIGPDAYGVKPRAKTAAAQRAFDPWVVEAPLDGVGKRVLGALNEWMWVAYASDTGDLVRTWAGGAEPAAGGIRSLGTPFFSIKAGSWRLRKEGAEQASTSRLLGHAVEKDALVLRIEVVSGNTKVVVIESPEHVEAGVPTLARRLDVRGLPDGWTLHLDAGPAVDKRTISMISGNAKLETRHGRDAIELQNGRSEFRVTWKLRGGL